MCMYVDAVCEYIHVCVSTGWNKPVSFTLFREEMFEMRILASVFVVVKKTMFSEIGGP